MVDEALMPGDAVLAALPSTLPPGHEQIGKRPVVVVGVPERPRFPMLVVVPLTASIGAWASAHPALYPIVKAGAAQLTRDSAVLTDHVRGMDAQRLEGYIGTLSHEEYTPIKKALRRVLGFGGEQ